MEDTHQLLARATYCYDSLGRRYTCRSTWSSWGRWVAFAVIVIGALIVFFLIACISARRRRKAGHKPFYGTGWAGNMRPMGGQQQQQYNPNFNTQQPQYGYQGGPNTAAPPNYNQSTGGYYGQPQGEAQAYFGGQRGDVEMNNNNNNTYAPPVGPPPGKAEVR